MLVERRLEHPLESGAVLSERLALDHQRLHAGRLGALEPERIGLVRDHQRNLRRKIRGSGALDQRGHVGAAAGDQDGNAAFHHSARSR